MHAKGGADFVPNSVMPRGVEHDPFAPVVQHVASAEFSDAERR